MPYVYFSFIVHMCVSFQMAALMIALFIGSWLPYALVASFSIVGLNHLVTPYVAELPVMLAKASAIWNPIVYALKHPRYRSMLAEYLPENIKACCCRRYDGKSSSIHRSETQKRQIPATIAKQVARDNELIEMHHHIAAADAAGGGHSNDNCCDDVDIAYM